MRPTKARLRSCCNQLKETTIRRVWHNEEWWFAIVDVEGVLTDSVQPAGYVKDLRRRDPELPKGWGQIATPFVFRRQAVQSEQIAPTPKACSVSSSPSRCPRPSPSNAGWRRVVTSASMRWQ